MRSADFIEIIAKKLRELSGKTVAILTHAGGDPDSIGAAYVLSNMLEKLMSARALLEIPEGPSTHSAALMGRLGISSSENVDNADAYLVLDCGSPEQLGDSMRLLESGKPVLVIDHHSTSAEKFGGGAEVHAMEEYSSVCEIIFDLAEHLCYDLSIEEAEALFAGIYYDTARLSLADHEALRKACALASRGINPRMLLQGLEVKMDLSERVARLKAAARMRVYRAGDWIIAVSRLSSFQSSAARSLVNLGAHVAIVGGESDEGITLSFRALNEFIDATGINLGRDIAARIGEEFGGHGGGHASAAKALCRRGGLEEILGRCLELIGERLGERLRELQP
ncbi:MAG: DHH family phosphoesterase [Nitrososphaerota archaeon]